jgi:hypothetical protein
VFRSFDDGVDSILDGISDNGASDGPTSCAETSSQNRACRYCWQGHATGPSRSCNSTSTSGHKSTYTTDDSTHGSADGRTNRSKALDVDAMTATPSPRYFNVDHLVHFHGKLGSCR